jgi:large subunit ribosomal protein L22
MPGPKTNEREGTRAVLRWANISAFKVREVVDAIRGKPVREAEDLLRFVERDCAAVVQKLLHSAVANAQNNEGLDPDELYVSACYADEGPTAKRWRPRARGRATRIRKRSCHITLIVSRMPEAQLARLQARRRAENLAMRARRVEATRRARAEAGEGASRRQRRHPEAFAAEAEEQVEAPDEGAAEEGTEAAAPGRAPVAGEASDAPDDGPARSEEAEAGAVEAEEASAVAAEAGEAASAEAEVGEAPAASGPADEEGEKDS